MSLNFTSFIDFTLASGAQRMSTVEDIKHREEYGPAQDFYRRAREGIVAVERAGGGPSALKKRLADVTNATKQKHFEALARGYAKFHKAHPRDWREPPVGEWIDGDFRVRVNPEVTFAAGGTVTAVKLYFKAEPIPKRRAQTTLEMMASTLVGQGCDQVAVLDIRSGSLHVATRSDPRTAILLRSEAAAFQTIWDSIP